jgi:parallel beta-helix repeat protein
MFDALEQRRLFAAVFTVTNTNDSGGGSLRQAFLDANTAPTMSLVSIVFDIPGKGVHTIKPLSGLPAVTAQLDLQGTTDSAGNPLIEIDGEDAGLSTIGLSFVRATPGNTRPSVVSGLIVNRFSGEGINIDGNEPTDIFGCRIGTDATGTKALGNLTGVLLDNDNDQIGMAGAGPAFQTIISGNTQDGITDLSNDNTIQNCFIGTDVTGTKALPNLEEGIRVIASYTMIGGSRAGQGNLISGNGDNGIDITTGQFNTILRNKIGTNGSGTAAIGNTAAGIRLDTISDNEIGDDSDTDENVISGNKEDGVFIVDGSANDVEGNLIGTDATGTKPLGNIGSGVHIADSSTNDLEDNIICGNHGDGIFIEQSMNGTATGNKVSHAFDGTNDSDGDLSIPNHGNGIDIVGASDTVIVNSYVRNNGLAGVEINGDTATGNDFQFGALFNNAKLGISIGDNTGTTHPNHPVSTGGGAGAGGGGSPDDSLNHPVLTSAVAVGQHTTVSGTYLGDSGDTFTIDIYESSSADPTGFGQGQEFLDSTQVTTDNSGNASFNFNVGDSPEFGASTVYTAIAKLDIIGGTDISEFSNAVKVTGASISGTVFNDANGNGKQDAGEKGIAKQIVFIDTNGDGIFDEDHDLFAITNSNGNYTLIGAALGALHLRLSVAPGFVQTIPNAKKPFYKLTITSMEHLGGNIFGEQKTKAASRTIGAPLAVSAASMFDADDRKGMTLDELLSPGK